LFNADKETNPQKTKQNNRKKAHGDLGSTTDFLEFGTLELLKATAVPRSITANNQSLCARKRKRWRQKKREKKQKRCVHVYEVRVGGDRRRHTR